MQFSLESAWQHDGPPPSVNPDSQAGSEQQRHEVGEEETGVGEASPTASLRGRLDGAGQGQRPVFGGGGTRYGRAGNMISVKTT